MKASPQLVLASGSARRRELLYQIGLEPDKIVATDIDETPLANEKPADLVHRLAVNKMVAAGLDTADSFILAADTAVAVGRRVLSKPAGEMEARVFLKLMSGRRHRVYTAVAAHAPDGRQRVRIVNSVVAIKRLSEEEISWYLASGEWCGKAGGYAIQGYAGRFVRFLRGSYSNVVGLPLFETVNLLENLGYPVRGGRLDD